MKSRIKFRVLAGERSHGGRKKTKFAINLDEGTPTPLGGAPFRFRPIGSLLVREGRTYFRVNEDESALLNGDAGEEFKLCPGDILRVDGIGIEFLDLPHSSETNPSPPPEEMTQFLDLTAPAKPEPLLLLPTPPSTPCPSPPQQAPAPVAPRRRRSFPYAQAYRKWRKSARPGFFLAALAACLLMTRVPSSTTESTVTLRNIHAQSSVQETRAPSAASTPEPQTDAVPAPVPSPNPSAAALESLEDMPFSTATPHSIFFEAIRSGELDVVQSLTQSEVVDPATAVEWSRTALIMAVDFGERDIVKFLLDLKVPVNTRDSQGRTALMYAARHGDAAVVGALLQAGADPNLRDLQGKTALDFARKAQNKKIISLLK